MFLLEICPSNLDNTKIKLFQRIFLVIVVQDFICKVVTIRWGEVEKGGQNDDKESLSWKLLLHKKQAMVILATQIYPVFGESQQILSKLQRASKSSRGLTKHTSSKGISHNSYRTDSSSIEEEVNLTPPSTSVQQCVQHHRAPFPPCT